MRAYATHVQSQTPIYITHMPISICAHTKSNVRIDIFFHTPFPGYCYNAHTPTSTHAYVYTRSEPILLKGGEYSLFILRAREGIKPTPMRVGMHVRVYVCVRSVCARV